MKKGFTLVELLACLTILAIMLLVIVPNISDSIKERKEESFFTSAKSILRQIEYMNIDSDATEIWSLCDIDIKEDGSSYDLENSYVKFNNGEISLNLIGDGSFDGMYLCGIDSSTKISNNLVSYTSCTPFITEEFTSLTLNLNGATTTQTIRDEYLVGSKLKLITPTKSGYIFTGWILESGNALINDDVVTIGNTDSTISAQFVAGYNLKVDLDGGTTKKDYNGLYKLNDQILLETPSKSGYTFIGWEVINGSSTITNKTLTINSNTTIKALYEQD